jgi:hypothetical protein
LKDLREEEADEEPRDAVIPREGVESGLRPSDDRQHSIAGVIPREGVERLCQLFIG